MSAPAPTSGNGSDSGLALLLDMDEPVVVGLTVPATLRVMNRGSVEATVSSRLNLFEGDIRLSVTDPNGAMRLVTGWQADTLPREVALPPGRYIESGVNLLWTGAGPTFPTPGGYVLRAEYDPWPGANPVRAPDLAISARLPHAGAESSVAELLKDDALREALVLARSDAAPEKLRILAQQFGQTLDGKLAMLLLSTADVPESVPDRDIAPLIGDPVTLALWITMLSTPYSRSGRRLAERLVGRIESHGFNTAAGQPERPAALDKALRILRRQPIESR